MRVIQGPDHQSNTVSQNTLACTGPSILVEYIRRKDECEEKHGTDKVHFERKAHRRGVRGHGGNVIYGTLHPMHRHSLLAQCWQLREPENWWILKKGGDGLKSREVRVAERKAHAGAKRGCKGDNSQRAEGKGSVSRRHVGHEVLGRASRCTLMASWTAPKVLVSSRLWQ